MKSKERARNPWRMHLRKNYEQKKTKTKESHAFNLRFTTAFGPNLAAITKMTAIESSSCSKAQRFNRSIKRGRGAGGGRLDASDCTRRRACILVGVPLGRKERSSTEKTGTPRTDGVGVDTVRVDSCWASFRFLSLSDPNSGAS